MKIQFLLNIFFYYNKYVYFVEIGFNILFKLFYKLLNSTTNIFVYSLSNMFRNRESSDKNMTVLKFFFWTTLSDDILTKIQWGLLEIIPFFKFINRWLNSEFDYNTIFYFPSSVRRTETANSNCSNHLI